MNKKHILPLLLSIFTIPFVSNAQTMDDSFNYTYEQLYGTPRFVAMSGAFGALGGDLSALKVNPAGSAVFSSNMASFTLDNQTYRNAVSIGDATTHTKNNVFSISQAGAVFVFNNYNTKSTINKFSVALNFETKNSLNNKIFGFGKNNYSIGDYFASQANGIPLSTFNNLSTNLTNAYIELGDRHYRGLSNRAMQNAFLGYETFIINPTSNNNNTTTYQSNFNGTSYNKAYEYRATGYNGVLVANAAMALKDKIYLGLNLNSHFINYEKRNYAYEETKSPASNISSIDFENFQNTIGTGFSVQIGAIAKLTNSLRVGASYHSPTWYTISDETSQFLESFDSSNNKYYTVAPDVINLYPNYDLRTPSKLNASVAYIVSNKAIISFDYGYQDYANIKYYANNYDPIYFDNLNHFIKNNYKAVSTYKIGAEYRIKALSLRGGYRYEESPYKNNLYMSDLEGFSFGLGYTFYNIRIDASYDYASRDYFNTFQHSNQATGVSHERDNVSLGISFNF